MEVLKTKRLILRHLEKGDIQLLHRIISKPDVMRYYDHPEDLKKAQFRVEKTIRHYKSHGHGFYACINKETHAFIGICGLIPQENVNGVDEIEVGYILDSTVWNQGLATEAAFACFEHGFYHFGYKRLVSIIDPKNAPSIRVAEKNGLTFKYETWRMNKTMVVYSITEEQWEANQLSRAL